MIQTIKDVEKFFTDRRNIGIKLGLQRVEALLHDTNHPEKKLRAIHVAGTNGKGSTIHYLQQALRASNYRVGVFTSPSFTGITGHFLIDGEEIKVEEMIHILNRLLPYIHKLDRKNEHPTEYEILTVIGMIYFSKHADIALIETAMGGREDTTNCFIPLLSIITNVSMDHTAFLGETIAAITEHKAGIIKKNRPVIVGKINEVGRAIIEKKASTSDAPLYMLHEAFTYKQQKNVPHVQFIANEHNIPFTLTMQGEHQIENASLALMALNVLEQHQIRIDWEKAVNAIEKTTIIGRFEQISKTPIIILDSAHNVASIEAFLQTVEKQYKHREKALLFAAFKDKQLAEMVTLLTQQFKMITFTTFAHERAAEKEHFRQIYNENEMTYNKSWQCELRNIINDESETVYFITGSLHFITLVRQWLLNP